MLNFLPKKILQTIKDYNVNNIFEIRIKKDKPFYINYNGVFKKIDYIVSEKELNDIFLSVCSYSVYSYSNSINNGYITTNKGVRIGIAGEFLYENNKISSVKNISSFVIRVAHSVKNSSNKIWFLYNKGLVNIFIISSPGLGKTTILRDLAYFLSNKEYRVVVVDEKQEIFIKESNVGNCVDVLSGIKKKDGIDFAIKNLNPEILVLDELSNQKEVDMVYSAIYSGIKLLTTTHAKNYLEFKNKPLFKVFLKNKIFDYYIFLGDKIGEIKEIIDKNGKNIL